MALDAEFVRRGREGLGAGLAMREIAPYDGAL
jgi:hypothetical protein